MLLRGLAVRYRFVAAAVALLAVAAPAQLPPAPPNTLVVEIKTTTFSSLPGLAKIELLRGDMPVEEQFADSRGRYTFSGLQEGEYTAAVTLHGFARESRTTFLRGGSTVQLSFLLHPEAASGGPAVAAGDPLVDQRWLATPQKVRDELQQAREARRNKDFVAAVAHCTSALQVDPKSVLANQELGLAHWQSGETGKARRAFEAAVQDDPAFLPAYLALSDMLVEKKDYAGASDALMKAAKAQPQRAEPFKAIAQIQLTTGHLDKAEQACKLGLARDHSRIPEIFVVLANVYLRRGDQEGAAEALQAYLSRAPTGEMAEQVRRTLDQIKPAKQ